MKEYFLAFMKATFWLLYSGIFLCVLNYVLPELLHILISYLDLQNNSSIFALKSILFITVCIVFFIPFGITNKSKNN